MMPHGLLCQWSLEMEAAEALSQLIACQNEERAKELRTSVPYMQTFVVNRCGGVKIYR